MFDLLELLSGNFGHWHKAAAEARFSYLKDVALEFVNDCVSVAISALTGSHAFLANLKCSAEQGLILDGLGIGFKVSWDGVCIEQCRKRCNAANLIELVALAQNGHERCGVNRLPCFCQLAHRRENVLVARSEEILWLENFKSFVADLIVEQD
jgi:hypothetical protein